MFPQAQAVINTLPSIGSPSRIYLTAITVSNALVEVAITSLTVRYGSAKILNNNFFIPQDTNPICLQAVGTIGANDYGALLYTQATLPTLIPDNFGRLVQKYPKGVFTDLNENTVAGIEIKARASMIDDYYLTYKSVLNQIYISEYNPDLEFELNNTIGLLSNSTEPVKVLKLLNTLSTVRLTSYDLELAVSRYIYYRLGIISAVFIQEHVLDPANYWNLGIPGKTELGSTTILAPNDFKLSVKNLDWTIYNSGSFTDNFKNEIDSLIHRISRADIGNTVTFSNIVDPTDDGFELIGYTYPTDPRLLFERCLQFIGDDAFPLNIIGYKKILT